MLCSPVMSTPDLQQPLSWHEGRRLRAWELHQRGWTQTHIAEALGVTQGAVSRQVKALEEQLEVELFHRERQTIRLTVGGDAYAREIRDALRKISTASLNLRANPFGGTLTLAILPTFGTRWLAPVLEMGLPRAAELLDSGIQLLVAKLAGAHVVLSGLFS